MADIRTFDYQARDERGKRRRGTMDAASRTAAMERLQHQGMEVTRLKESSGSVLTRDIQLSSFQKRPGLREITLATRQLATMLQAGLTLVRGLSILQQQTENEKLAEVFAAVRRDIERGNSLSSSLHRQTGIFPPLLVHMVEAGEAGGFLADALDSAADAFDTELKLRDTVKSAMTYPVIVLIIAVLAVIAMLLFIVPIFEDMFDSLGGELPVLTQLMVTVSSNMLWIAPLILLAVLTAVLLWRRYGSRPEVARSLDRIRHRTPVFGRFFKQVAIARFTKTLATTIHAGVPILQSLTIVKQTAGSPLIESAVDRTADGVANGRSLAKMMAREEIFPPLVSQLVAVGEDTGSLDKMLAQVAEFMQREVQITAQRLTALVEPVLIVIVGLIIGGMVMALYLPIFGVFDQIGGM